MELTEKQRIQIIKFIVAQSSFLGNLASEEGGIVEFLDMLWELRTMPSTDTRYSNAYDDAWQHLVRNDDWTYEQVFLDRFPDTYKDEKTFKRFVGICVHPSLFEKEETRRSLIESINGELAKVHHKLIGADYFEGKLVYVVVPSTDLRNQLPEDIAENEIPFFFGNQAVRRYPCFELEEDRWNDWFTYYTKFLLLYKKDENNGEKIGMLKLMNRGADKTAAVLPNEFLKLGDDWCSIGMEYEYYGSLKKSFSTTYQSVLYALRDTALFPSIYEAFEDDPCFNNSLLRKEPYSSNPSLLLDSVRYRLQGIKVDSYYKFSYEYEPPYAKKDGDDHSTIIDFDFTYNVPFEQRIYGVIGKNGSGKTTMLSKIAQSFQMANDKCIMPRKPLYNKVMSISFSVFDSFPLPESDARFNYRYLGLKHKEGDMLQNLRTELRTHLIGINSKGRTMNWCNFLREVLHEQLSTVITQEAGENNIDVEAVMQCLQKLSSGENLLIYVFTSLLDEIKQNTLILFDEPEMHLHPNAISSLIQYLYELLEQYNSFCILATHSPLVIQEIPSDNVIIFKREQSDLVVQTLPYETYSQDLTTVTEEVFGDVRPQRSHYKTLKRLANSIRDYDEIIRLLNNSGRPVPLGTRMLLKTMLRTNAQSQPMR